MKQTYIYLMMMFILLILMVLMILISVAFLTLMERKLLSYIQIRKGPNKVGFIGLIQPFSDALKLIFKEFNFIKKSNFMYYYFSPLFMLILIMMMWLIYPFWINLNFMEFNFIYLMCCFSLGVFGMSMCGWSSNSSYSMLGAIRTLSQSISYEVSLAILLITMMLMVDSYNYNEFYNFQENFSFFFMVWPLMVMLMFSLMAELNRTPFDFSEGESELVSGFNVEYSSGSFILIFLSEYASIIFMSLLFNLIFFNMNILNFMFYFKIVLLSSLIILIRGTLPRFRYDLLMNFCWLKILPFSLYYMLFLMIYKMM
nr:NADH deshydrogenase subunit 1 [Euceros serricornis]